jgi:hypothetical protein
MARRVAIVRILIALIIFLNILFHFQLYGRHWIAIAVVPVVILLFFFLLDLIQQLIGALYPTRRWLCVLKWPLVIAGLLVVWWNQPYFGANVCLATGFMREQDFVEEMRPTLLEIVERNMRRQQGEPSAGRAVESAVATADRAIDLLKQCVGERGRDLCRYIGPDRDGWVRHGRTIEGPSSMRAEDEYKYRMFYNGAFEILIRPQDAGGTDFIFRILNGRSNLAAGALICNLGCDCNRDYHRH